VPEVEENRIEEKIENCLEAFNLKHKKESLVSQLSGG
jgi:energy-coupling factor transporter ATP-binding protein EcfA2